MNLIALLAGLLIERLATQLFHLRQLRWLDNVIDAGFGRAARLQLPPLAAVVVLVLVLVLPLLLVLLFFGHLLYDVGYLVMAIIVLFFSLGPKDIGEQVDDYCAAVEQDDAESIRRTARALLEREVPDDEGERTRAIEEAVCVQANNRLFAVIFWFVLLGPLGLWASPLGAWTYRATDLIRRRAVFTASRDSVGDDGAGTDGIDDSADAGDDEDTGVGTDVADAASTVHGWLVWVPARLTALGYALAGSFDGGIGAWRQPDPAIAASSREQSERLLARVGTAALALHMLDEETSAQRAIRGASAANGLVFRLLGIWAVIIAAMTLYGWSV